ncbi:MAG: PQQ-binding-like beta-propeller repeat protein, partial [Chloroflexota bacterium]
PADGAERWTVKADGWVWSTPLIAGDTLYFGDLAGSIYSLNAVKGSVNWKSQLGGSVRGAPALSGETLVIPADNGIVYAVNTADGSTAWQTEIDLRNADRLLANPVVAGDAVLIAAMNAEMLVYALNISSGDVLWTFKP